MRAHPRQLSRKSLLVWQPLGAQNCGGFPFLLDQQNQQLLGPVLARIIHEASTASADPGMSTAFRSFGLLDVLSSTPAGLSVARLVSTPVCAASLRTFMNNAG
jgi:hypothetical protein